MSALPLKTDVAERHLDVRFVPQGDIGPLFDDIIGDGEHSRQEMQFRASAQDETDELQRRRLQQMQMAGNPAVAGTRAALASPMGMFGVGGGGLR